MHSLMVETDNDEYSHWLKRVPLAGGNEARSEKWLQELLFAHPGLIPIREVAAGTAGFIPVCRELALPRSGGSVFLDIFGVTAEGRLVLIECKLWRNPQARREVMAQILEYASLLRGWSYADLTARLKAQLGWSGKNPLFDHVAAAFPGLEEARFVDQVARSLDTGDFALIIAGDGIRSDIHALTQEINQGSGLTARLALVEFQLWADEAGKTLIVPAVPLRTEIITQRIVITPEGQPVALEDLNDGDAETERDVNPEAEARRAVQRAFWQSFVDEVRFDHPDQPAPRHGGTGWVRIPLPAPVGSMTAFRTQGGEGGIFFRLKGEDGRALHNLIRDDLDRFRAETGEALGLEAETEEPFSGSVTWLFAGDARDDTTFRAWLMKAANAMVNAFRPFLAGRQE